jgi:hypothetical protein
MYNARHPADSTPDPITILVDPVGNSVRGLSLKNDYEPLKGKIRHGIWLQLSKLTTNAESEVQLYEKLLVDMALRRCQGCL